MIEKIKIRRAITKVGQVAKRLPLFVRQHVRRRHLYIAGGGVAAATLLYTAALYWPRTTHLSYADNTCLTNPVLLPSLFKSKQSPSFSADLQKSLTLTGFPLYSHKTCITLLQAPRVGHTETIALSLGGNSLLEKKIKVLAGNPPVLQRQAELDAPVPTGGTLDFTLESADQVFDYQLLANKREVRCTKQSRLLACNTSKAGPRQDECLPKSSNNTNKPTHRW